jgi:hypothetical protein
MAKNLRNALLIMAAVAIALAIIFNEFLAYSAIFVGAMIVFYGLYAAFLRTKDEEIEKLKNQLAQDETQLAKVREENEELRHRKLNISAIRQIFDVGLFEVDTNFTRTWNEEILTDDGKTVQFIGALRVDVIAKYGIDLHEIKVKKQGDEVLIANMQLKALSFSDLDYKWVIAEVLEHKKPYLGGRHRRTNTMLELEANKIKERLQKRIHEEVKHGPEELNTIVNVLKTQLRHAVATVLGLKDQKVRFVDEEGEGFEPIDGIKQIDSA